MSKGSKRRPGKGYEDNHEAIFAKPATWHLQCPRCNFRLPKGAAANPFCPDCKCRLHRHEDTGLELSSPSGKTIAFAIMDISEEDSEEE